MIRVLPNSPNVFFIGFWLRDEIVIQCTPRLAHLDFISLTPSVWQFGLL